MRGDTLAPYSIARARRVQCSLESFKKMSTALPKTDRRVSTSISAVKDSGAKPKPKSRSLISSFFGSYDTPAPEPEKKPAAHGKARPAKSSAPRAAKASGASRKAAPSAREGAREMTTRARETARGNGPRDHGPGNARYVKVRSADADEEEVDEEQSVTSEDENEVEVVTEESENESESGDEHSIYDIASVGEDEEDYSSDEDYNSDY